MQRSNRRIVIGAFVACAGLAGSVQAQDSTGILGSDALVPWQTNVQRTSYVLDLSPFTTSWGNEFAIGPLVKSSRSSTAFSSSLLSAQFISQDLLTGVPYASPTYSLWENGPGFGVNPTFGINQTGTPVTPTGASNQLAAAVAEFATTDGGFNFNGILGALVNYDPSDPGRLYVTRINAAVNTPSGVAGDSAQLGLGSVDANGNLYFRADAFGVAGTPGVPSVSGNNYFRTSLAGRGAVVNQITGNPALHNATTNLLTNSPTSHNTPNHIPQSLAGVPLVAGSSFGALYVRGSAAPLASDGSHLAAGVPDHRGGVGMTTKTPLGGITTLGILAKDAANAQTTRINLFSVNNAGNVVATRACQAPSVVTDNADGFTVTYTGVQDFGQYRSQTFARGGNGQVAISQDRNGLALAAATMHENGLQNDFSNQILVCRFNPSLGTEEWTIAAYIDQAFLSGRSGKEILDGSGNAVGVLTPLFNVTGGSLLGPSMSSPTFDGAGNIWFISAVELFDRLPGGGSDFDSAIIRAVYDEATFSYTLELVLELGQVFAGLNSGTDYQIRFLETADGGTSPSVSSGTVFSGNAAGRTWANIPLADLDNEDPRTNGGFVFQASIVYRGPLGDFDTINGAQQYNALMFIGNNIEASNPCPPCTGDWNGDTNVDFFDVLGFLGAFSASDPCADLVMDGNFDFFDILTFLSAFSAGCP